MFLRKHHAEYNTVAVFCLTNTENTQVLAVDISTGFRYTTSCAVFRIISPLVGPHRPATLSILFFSPPPCVMQVWGHGYVSSLTKETYGPKRSLERPAE